MFCGHYNFSAMADEWDFPDSSAKTLAENKKNKRKNNQVSPIPVLQINGVNLDDEDHNPPTVTPIIDTAFDDKDMDASDLNFDMDKDVNDKNDKNDNNNMLGVNGGYDVYATVRSVMSIGGVAVNVDTHHATVPTQKPKRLL